MSENKFYTNPVIARDFPDPFVFKFCAEYYAIATGFWHDGGVFGVLRSRDLINWTNCGSAINPVPFADSPCYWAPEVYYRNGKFYLYYSVGNEENMRIRAAVSDSPASGYVDAGVDLTSEQFAIDAHVFVDDADDSQWLFYATDFLDYDQIGTGTVCDKMISPFELAGKPQPVTRAKYDWQIYDPMRASKGNVRWHTIEGSTVLKRKSLYYQMFSGGNWQNISYGVSYATTPDINQTGEWSQIADGEITFPILRTIAEKVVGPGHNSVVRGANNCQLYCVYHRWATDLSGRQMAIDPLDFAGERMLIVGASFEPVLVPDAPTVFDFFDDENVFGKNWTVENLQNWTLAENSAVSNRAAENAQIVCQHKSDSFLVEVSVKAVEFDDKSNYGFCLKTNAETVLRCVILPVARQVAISAPDKNDQIVYDLPTDFEASAVHLWRVEVDHQFVKIRLDEASFIWQKQLETAPTIFALETQNCQAAFSGFALTEGFENLFDERSHHSEPEFAARGWTIENKDSNPQVWKIADNLLQCAVDSGETRILKNNKFVNFEFVVNARLDNKIAPSGCYGFLLRGRESEIFLTIENDNAEQFLNVSTAGANKRFILPEDFAVGNFAQFRFRATGGSLILQLENSKLGEIEIDETEKQFGILVKDATASFDMARITVIN